MKLWRAPRAAPNLLEFPPEALCARLQGRLGTCASQGPPAQAGRACSGFKLSTYKHCSPDFLSFSLRITPFPNLETWRCVAALVFFVLLQQVGSTRREAGSCHPRLCCSRTGKGIPGDGRDHPNPTALSSLKPPCPQGEQTQAARPATHTGLPASLAAPFP